jgi:hypothetical protein
VLALVMVAVDCPGLGAQDLAPRAYLITPVTSNAVTLGYSFNDGSLAFEGTVPITDGTGRLHVPSLAYSRSLSFFGRSANLTVVLPYGVGSFHGTVLEVEKSRELSGFFDSVFRFSVNLAGAPAMTLAEMRQWRQRGLLGLSLKVVTPTGEYDPTKLINLGANRWSFKPELGYSRRWDKWVIDGYAAVWFFTENPEFFSRNEYFAGSQSQTQEPIGAFEFHLSYDVRPRLWVSFDANFWYGGRTSLNGVENLSTVQKNSRFGFTASLPFTRHQSLKFGYADGAYIRFGGDYRIYSAAWQYWWIGKPN